jgi:RNA polymerase-binding transcription factor DksA
MISKQVYSFQNKNQTSYLRSIIKIIESMIEDQLRYSDVDLAEFKALIQAKLEKAKGDLELIKSAYMNDLNNGTDDTSPTFKAFEEGSETMSKEANSQLAIRQEKFIRDLKNALIRIENKTYGLCKVTGKLISKERLKIVPHATMSIEAKNLQR